jgi:5'-nucleotidase / UDP-sugar diphosphatase
MKRRLFQPPTTTTTLDLTILHDNDLHGHMLPFAYIEEERSKVEQASVGGAARRATLIRDLKKRARNPVMVINTGDTSTRGPMINAYEGVADIEVMNAVGYDLGCLGNNEFKLKDGIEAKDAAGAQGALLRFLRRSRFPWVCANMGTDANCPLPGVAPFVVREINGVKVGFLGLTAPRSASYPQTAGWWFSDPVESAKKWIPLARRECDILIAVTHIGVDLDKKVAAEITGIDAIVGGDSHTFLYKAEVVNGIPIVQTGEFGVNLGKFDLHFEKVGDSWKLASYKYVLMPITNKIREASDVKLVAERYARPLLENIVGKIDLKLIGKTPAERLKLTAQATVDALQRGAGVDLALTKPGDGMFEVFRTQNISMYDLHAVWPFKNNVATVRLTGTEIEALKAKVPDTVVSCNVLVLEKSTTYTVAFIDFVAAGTYEIAKEKLTDTKRDMRDVVIAGLK